MWDLVGKDAPAVQHKVTYSTGKAKQLNSAWTSVSLPVRHHPSAVKTKLLKQKNYFLKGHKINRKAQIHSQHLIYMHLFRGYFYWFPS